MHAILGARRGHPVSNKVLTAVLAAAVQQHASGSHGHDVSREHILAELVTL
ncbi:MAG: hypothetical protein ACRDPY_10630 [Streptosporangiaceae bacterium]